MIKRPFEAIASAEHRRRWSREHSVDSLANVRSFDGVGETKAEVATTLVSVLGAMPLPPFRW